MRDELSLAINGPIFEGIGFILSAVDCPTGQLLALKLLPTHEKRYTVAAAAEKRAVTLLKLAEYFKRYPGSEAKDDIPLMPTKLVQVCWVGSIAVVHHTPYLVCLLNKGGRV